MVPQTKWNRVVRREFFIKCAVLKKDCRGNESGIQEVFSEQGYSIEKVCKRLLQDVGETLT